MKNLFFVICMLPCLLFAQEDNPPTIFEVVRMKAKPGHEKQFEAAVKTHNAKYHPEGTYQAGLIHNINGPYGGEYAWVMGPMKFAALDTRPGEGPHDEEWNKSVMPHVEDIFPPSYWNYDVSSSHPVQNPANTKSIAWMYDLKSGKAAQFGELVKKIKAVFEAKRENEPFGLLWNTLSNTEGNDAVIIWSFEKWAQMDVQRNFGKEYEEVHGPGTWHTFLNHINETVKSRTDWMRTNVE